MSTIDDEIVQERRNMLKGIFPLMKPWYHSKATESLRNKYGVFPAFWQDLETWPHMKIMQKIFLSYTEKREAGLEEIDVMKIENNILEAMEVPKESNVDVIEEKPIAADEQPIKTEPKARKKSRWGTLSETITNDSSEIIESKTTGEFITENASTEPPRKRKSRFSQSESTASLTDLVPPPPSTTTTATPITTEIKLPFMAPLIQAPLVPAPITITQILAQQQAAAQSNIPSESIQQMLILKMQLQKVNANLLTVAQDAARIEADPNRSPSPPPKYDNMGKRTNTRVIRMRDQLMQERSQIVSELMKINPSFATSLDLMRSKPVRKLPIPVSQFPNQSFIGLIIGPRGNTQKRMEQETGCKISIKGKGMRGSMNMPGEEDEELHVYITGETEEGVEKAAQMVTELLQPKSEEELLKHKEKQLRELALINGTLREDEYCPVCGEKGHKQYECPARIKSFKAAGVKCSICGDGSHPTRDCPLKQQTVVGEGVLDSEYDSLMAELSGGSSTKKNTMSNNNTTTTAVDSAVIDTTNVSISGNTNDIEVTNLMNGTGKKQQTVIHSNTVLTGLSQPPLMNPTAPGMYPPGSMPGGYPSTTPYGYPNPYNMTAPTATPYGYYPQPTYDPNTGQYYYGYPGGAMSTQSWGYPTAGMPGMNPQQTYMNPMAPTVPGSYPTTMPYSNPQPPPT